MTIVKLLKDLISLPLRKKPFLLEMNRLIPPLLFASMLGTYLDLYFVGVGMYSFPKRFLPEIFSINVVFVLVGLPMLVTTFLIIMKNINIWKKAGFILIISLLMACAEKFSEELGFFQHHESWKHWYSFFGYITFLICVYLYYYVNLLLEEK